MIHPLTAATGLPAARIGAKAYGLVVLHRLGLPVPPAIVLDVRAAARFRRDGRLPDGLADAVRELTADRSTVSVRSGAPVSMPGMMTTVLDVPADRVEDAVREVLASWDTPRAVTYRALHDIPDDLGTAVIVQAMVFGDRDEHSGTGVAFSRDPGTGEPAPFGEVLFRARGEAVVSGRTATRRLAELAAREPAVWAELVDGLARLERHHRDACSVEFTYDSGRLWFLQARAGGLAGRAAVRVAVALADEGLTDRRTALGRVTAAQLRAARTPRIAAGEVLARGLGASAGVATGRVAVTAERAVRMAAHGPVILVRPHTSPLDMPGLAAARGVVTARGGPASHAAVVARALGRPAVVSAVDLVVDEIAGVVQVRDGLVAREAAAAVRCGGGLVGVGARVLAEGTVVTIDGTGGEVVLGDVGIAEVTADSGLERLLTWADEMTGGRPGASDEERLSAAQARIGVPDPDRPS